MVSPLRRSGIEAQCQCHETPRPHRRKRDRMRVLLLLDTLGPGGTETSTAALAPRLQRLGADVSIATLTSVENNREQEMRDEGIAVTVLRPGRWWQQLRELRALIRSTRPDVLHTALFASDQLGRVAAVGLPTRVVSSFVNVPRVDGQAATGSSRWKRRLVNLVDIVSCHLFVDRFHAVTPGVARLHHTAYKIPLKRIEVVERGRDPLLLGSRSHERRLRVRESLGIPPDAPVVVSGGRHEPQKAHHDLIEAMALVRQHHPAAVLLVAGREGSATKQLHEAIRTSGTTDQQVRLLGHRDDIADLLAAADVMALSSHFEGTAGIALEAMALGTPIVATRLDGMEGILVHEHNALVSPVGDPVAMAASINRMLDDTQYASRLGHAAASDFLGRFTLDRAAERMMLLYSATTARPTRARRRAR